VVGPLSSRLQTTSDSTWPWAGVDSFGTGFAAPAPGGFSAPDSSNKEGRVVLEHTVSSKKIKLMKRHLAKKQNRKPKKNFGHKN
jgi:hypothetical protein